MRHAHVEERARHLARDRRSGHVEELHRAELREAARAHLREDVHRVRGHAHHVGRAGLEHPVERLRAGRRVVDNELEARCHHLLHRHRSDVVAHGRQRQQHRAVVVMPVLDHRAAVREQGVVRMHHALRHARRAGGEGEVDDLVRVGIRRYRGRDRRIGSGEGQGLGMRSADRVHHLHEIQLARLRRDVVAARVRPIAGLHHQRRGAAALEQHDDLGDGVVLVQRRRADVAVARTGEQGDHAFGAGGQPHGDALPGAHARAMQVLGHRIDPRQQPGPGEAHAGIPQGEGVRPLRGVTREQRMERVAAPDARLVVAPGRGEVEQREEPAHQCPNLSGSGGRRARNASASSCDSSVSR